MRKSIHMCTKLPKSPLEERLRWVLPIVNKEVKLKDAAKLFPGGKRTLERWASNYRKYGEQGLIPGSTRPKSQPNETPIRIKERIIELRNETGLCAQKLNYKLIKENVEVSDRLVGKLIKNEGLVRKYRVRKLKYKYIKIPPAPGELVEIDIKYVPKKLKNKQYYQFTAIDTASRWRFLKIYEHMGNSEAMDFLEELIKTARFRIGSIKTDNGSCFTNRYTGYLKSTDYQNPRLHPFDLQCQKYNIIHYLIDPGKPAQNGKIERSHRTDQEHFYERVSFSTPAELRRRIKIWNNEYNNLEHCALNGATPNEYLLNN